MRYILPVLALISLGFALFWNPEAALRGRADAGAVGTGETAPEFSLTDLDGDTRTAAEFRGKVVLIYVFASW